MSRSFSVSTSAVIVVGLLCLALPAHAEPGPRVREGQASAYRNARLGRSDRLDAARPLLKGLGIKTIAPELAEGILEAHAVGTGELGKDGIHRAGILRDGRSNFTIAQLRRKTKILEDRAAQLGIRDKATQRKLVRTLFDHGITGDAAERDLRPVTLRMAGDFWRSLSPTRTGTDARLDTTLQVDTDAIAELGRAGVDLSVAGVHISKQKFSVDQVSMRAANPNVIPMAPELGRLVFEIRPQDAMRRSPDAPRVATWNGAVGQEFHGYTFADFAVVWEHPAVDGKSERTDLLRFRSGTNLAPNLRFTLRELLEASAAAHGEPVPKFVADALPLDGLQSTIGRAKGSGVIGAKDAAQIVADGEAGGVSPAKVALILSTYRSTPVVSWTEPSTRPGSSPVLSHAGAVALRAFLFRHGALATENAVEAEQQALQNHPLPAPPAKPEYPLAYVSGGSPDYNIPHQTPLVHAATEDQLWVKGGAGGLHISIPGGTIELPAPSGGLRVGEVYEGGPRIVAGGRRGGGYVMNERGRFKVHELEVDRDGTVRKAVVSWIAITQGGFGANLGLSPGHLVYEHPPLPRAIEKDPTWKALVTALKEKNGRYDASALFRIMGDKGYVDDSVREILRALRREHGGDITDRVDVELMRLIKSTGVLPITESGLHPVEMIQNVLRNRLYAARSAEYIADGTKILQRSLEVLQTAVGAGYRLSDADKQGLTEVLKAPDVNVVRPLLTRLGIVG